MSGKFNPFNNPKSALYFIYGFIALFILVALVAVKDAKAEMRIEAGAAFLSAEYSDGAALFFSEVWDDKYLLGFGIVGNQKGEFSEGTIDVRSNMVVQAQRLVTYKRITLGIGPAYWQHTNRAIGSELLFALSLGVNVGKNWDIMYRHFSNGGTASPNSGQDLLLIGYRFK